MVKTIEFLPKIRYKDRPAFSLLISCIGGVLLFAIGEVVLGSIIAGAVLLGLLVTATFLKQKKDLQTKLINVSLMITLAILFSWYFEFKTAPSRSLTKGITLYDTEVEIIEPVASSLESEYQFIAMVDHNGYRYKVRMKTPRDEMIPEEYYFGVTLRGTLDLAPMSSIRSENYRQYLLSEGFEAVGNIQDINAVKHSQYPSIKSIMSLIRYRLVENLEEASTKNNILNREERGLIYALTLGDRSHLPKEIKESFNTSGVAHILAVSGYHLGIIFMFLSLLWSQILPHYHQRKIRYLFLLIGLLLYTFISGASTATMRALVMSVIALCAKLLDRDSDPIQLLSLTLLFFLISTPYSYLSIGLSLSIGAVWGIYMFLPLFQEYLKTKIRGLRYLINIILVSVSAQIGIFPLLLFYFGNTTISFIWSNIPMVLLSSILIPLALGVLLILPVVGTLPDFIFKLLGSLTDAMIKTTEFFASLSGGRIETNIDIPILILYYLFIILLYPLLYRRANRHHIDKLS